MRVVPAAEVADLAGARLHGDAGAEIGPDVVIDARLATPGSVFVAIRGERVDGHDFTGQAAANGARAVIGTRVTDAPLSHFVVDDSVQGLSRLARGVVAREKKRGLVVIAITGSSGKTSTKDLLAQVLEHAGPTVSPVGSFNNEIGVPLTACGVDERTKYLISEMGARGIGHLRWLTEVIPPSVSMVLNVGHAHVGEFGSVEAIAQAKGELVEALAPSGWAVLNADDPRVAAMRERTGARVAWFSAVGRLPADAALGVEAVDIENNALEQYAFTLAVHRLGQETEAHPVTLQVLGAHQVSNALAAAAGAIAAGVPASAVARSLSMATPRSKWRMQLDVRSDGAAILNDSYNANPDSMAAALASFGKIAANRRSADPGSRSHAVLGDMLELGSDAAEQHALVGRLAAEAGIGRVVAVGEYAADIARGARAAGAEAVESDKASVASLLTLGPSDVVLVKASRGLALDEVAAQLMAQVVDRDGARQ